MSFSKQIQRSSGVYGTKTFLAWAVQALMILNPIVGVVFKALLKLSAASILLADRRLILVA
jgi:hypothetical protein